MGDGRLEELIAACSLQPELDALAAQHCPSDRRRYHAALYDALGGALLLLALLRQPRFTKATIPWLLQMSTLDADKRGAMQQAWTVLEYSELSPQLGCEVSTNGMRTPPGQARDGGLWEPMPGSPGPRFEEQRWRKRRRSILRLFARRPGAPQNQFFHFKYSTMSRVLSNVPVAA